MSGATTNWGGNHTYRAPSVQRPATLGELQRIVAGSTQLSVIGTRHTFNAIGDGASLVDLSAIASPPVVDVERDLVSVSGATTYAGLVPVLARHDRALPNLASLPHLSVAGAIATGTHGSGSGLGSLATSVESIELLTADGDVDVFHREESEFPGAVVHLGALGVVTRLTLRLEEGYEVGQTVYDGLGWDTLTRSFDDVFDSATSVSVFTRWGEAVGELWCKQRVDESRNDMITSSLTPADSARHPIPGGPASNCTEQGGVRGPWWDRMPHFGVGAQPSAGAEIQSEFFVPRSASRGAIDALRGIGPALDEVLFVSEIRTIDADDLWMSPCHGRASTGLHFTWKPDPPRVAAAVERVAEALAPFEPRPHWGKVVPARWRARGSYERLDDFLALKHRLDPEGRFTSPWIAERLGEQS